MDHRAGQGRTVSCVCGHAICGVSLEGLCGGGAGSQPQPSEGALAAYI